MEFEFNCIFFKLGEGETVGLKTETSLGMKKSNFSSQRRQSNDDLYSLDNSSLELIPPVDAKKTHQDSREAYGDLKLDRRRSRIALL